MNIKEEIKLISKLKNSVHSKNGKLLNAYISGSHLYGWESKDSDIDIRGCFILKKEEFLGLNKPKEVLEIKTKDNNDIVLFEIKKLVSLAIKGNCNILEEINSSQFYKNADFVKLKQLINNAFGKRGIYNCFDMKTEILTENGWKLFKDLKKDEKIATLNSKGYLEYNLPNKYYSYDYKGKMFHQIGKTINIKVTPNHNLYVKRRYNHKINNFVFEEAEKSKRHILYKCDTKWEGSKKKKIDINGLTINMDDWLNFFGIWLADGFTIKNYNKASYRIGITQKNKQNLRWIKKIITKCGFHTFYNNGNYSFHIKNKKLYFYLKQFGKSDSKYIPKELLQLSKSQLKLLFMSYLKGDGHKIDKKRIETCGWEGYTACATVSKKLADNLQEIIFKLGLVSILKIKKPHIRIFNRKKYLCKQQYLLTINKTNLQPRLNGHRDNRAWEDYKGKIYCVNVRNNLIYVRRDGKACWSGNSYRGLAEFNYKRFILRGRNTIKKYLYVFRGLMAGIYCLQTGLIKPNIEELNKHFKIKEVTKLLKMKRAGKENEPLVDLETGIIDDKIKELFDKLDEAYLKCKMPEKPTDDEITEVNNFLIKLRKQS